MRRATKLVTGLVGFLAPPAVFSPTPQVRRPEIATLEDAVKVCQESELSGWPLVDFATSLVNDKYSHYSAWHLWLTPEQSFAQSQGLSLQYNQALAAILTSLGVELAVVQCARVRQVLPRPWWLAGHVWLKVSINDQTRDVCAGNASNRAGDVDFTPIADVHPFRRISHLTLCTFGAFPVATTVWRAWLRGDQIPSWLYREFSH